LAWLAILVGVVVLTTPAMLFQSPFLYFSSPERNNLIGRKVLGNKIFESLINYSKL